MSGGGTGGDDGASSTRQYISLVEESVNRDAALLNRTIAPAAVRAHVTRVIIYFFVVYVAVVGLYVIFAPTLPPDRISNLLEVLKTAIIPIVTFVIGHYFGSKSA
jgi:uncharacterized membrane protein